MEQIKKKKTYKSSKTKKSYSSRMTGEDIDMFNERKYENEKKKSKNVCDRHIDGA